MAAIRGAITVENDTKKEVLEATCELLEQIIKLNNLEIENIEAITFTATSDITSVYPAVAARKLGITSAALMCVQEMYVEGSLRKCIRVMLQICTTMKQKDVKHVYLKGASVLRPDLNNN